MKYVIAITGTIMLLLFGTVSRTYAACNWAHDASSVIATTCGIDGQSQEYYDYSAGEDDPANDYTVVIPSGVTVTVNAGASEVSTELGVGKFDLSGNGVLAVSANYIEVILGTKCYVYDGDGDGYAEEPNTCSIAGGDGYVRKNKLTGTTADCGPDSANAKPGQTSYFTTSFTNTITGLSYDWNCNGAQEKQYETADYTCVACTNASGYASTRNTTNGFSGSTPACGAAGTYYTVTNTTCRDPAVTACSGSYSTSSMAQPCR